MQTPVATNHAEMMANIRAAIASAPAYQYEGSHIPEFRPLADGEPIEPDLMAIDTRAPMVYMHGPTRPHDLRISIRYCIDGVRGSYTVPHGADRLQVLADKVARLAPAFDGKPRMRRLPQGLPKKSRVTAAGSFGVVRQLLDDRQYAEALALAQSNCGPVFIGHAAKGTRADATMADALSRAVYLQCVNHSAGGVDWIIGRHAAPGGRWRILHASSGLWLNRRDASDCATHEFRSAADAMATIDQWTAEDNEAEYARKIIAACHRAAPFNQAAALADLTGSAPEPIAEEIQPEPAADDAAPVSDCMAAIIEAARPDDAEPAAVRYSFEIHLITAAGPDTAGGHRIASERYLCAGPGLTSADIRGANVRLREVAAAHGSRVVMEGFGDGGARAWCEPIAPDAPPVPAAPAARDLSLSYAAHVAQSRAIGIRPMSYAQWKRNNTPKPAAPIAPPNPGKPGRAAHAGRCSARRPGVAVRIKPAAPPIVQHAAGFTAPRPSRGIGADAHRIVRHQAGRLPMAARGMLAAAGCAGLLRRAAGRAAAPRRAGPDAGMPAGPGPPGCALPLFPQIPMHPRPADSRTLETRHELACPR